MGETERIWNQLQRSFEGNEAWKCPSLRDLLAEVTAAQAAAHPIPAAPSIWELLLHTTAHERVACRRLAGEAVATLPDALGWPKRGNPPSGMSYVSLAGPMAAAIASHCSAPKVALTRGTAARTSSAAIWVRQPTTYSCWPARRPASSSRTTPSDSSRAASMKPQVFTSRRSASSGVSTAMWRPARSACSSRIESTVFFAQPRVTRWYFTRSSLGGPFGRRPMILPVVLEV